jgi:hypothetical protein
MIILRTAALAACLLALWFTPQVIQRTAGPCSALALVTGKPVNVGTSPAIYENSACVAVYWATTGAITVSLMTNASPTARYAGVEQ